jgi:hypothetical protein
MTASGHQLLLLLACGYGLALFTTMVTGAGGVHGGCVRRMDCPHGYWIIIVAYASAAGAALILALAI